MAAKLSAGEKESLAAHVKKLGLSSTKEYVRWCSLNGFGSGLLKSSDRRTKEREFVKEQSLQKVVKKSKKRLKKTGDQLKAFTKGELEKADMNRTLLRLNEYIGSSYIPAEEVSDFLNFLLKVHEKSDMMDDDTPAMSSVSRWTYTESLVNVFMLRSKWVKIIDTWNPKIYNKRRQFSSLVRHLFSIYEIPLFMDSAWFFTGVNFTNEQGVTSNKYREWFIALARGGNIRKVEGLPYEMTKKMSHHFMQAPSDYSVTNALRFAHTLGSGGDAPLAEQIIHTSLIRTAYDEFWNSVVNFFIRNPMLDRNQLGPIVDYINNQKFSAEAPQPGFSMKKRDPNILLEQVERWHAQLRRESVKKYKQWEPSGINSYQKEEGLQGRKSYKCWTIVELLDSSALHKEGNVMGHCVSSYSSSCVSKRVSIWSLRLNARGSTEKLITIEVNLASKSVTQTRGRANRLPKHTEWAIIDDWAMKADLNVRYRAYS